MLTIRLRRKGKKNQPFFRVVLMDKKRSANGGDAIEDLGYKNPLTKKISINKERVLYWLKNGAQPSATVHNLLISEKIIDDKKIHVSKLSKKAKEAVVKAAADATAAAAAKAAAEAKPAPVVEEPKPETPVEPAVTEEQPKQEEPKPEEKPVEPQA